MEDYARIKQTNKETCIDVRWVCCVCGIKKNVRIWDWCCFSCESVNVGYTEGGMVSRFALPVCLDAIVPDGGSVYHAKYCGAFIRTLGGVWLPCLCEE